MKLFPILLATSLLLLAGADDQIVQLEVTWRPLAGAVIVTDPIEIQAIADAFLANIKSFADSSGFAPTSVDQGAPAIVTGTTTAATFYLSQGAGTAAALRAIFTDRPPIIPSNVDVTATVFSKIVHPCMNPKLHLNCNPPPTGTNTAAIIVGLIVVIAPLIAIIYMCRLCIVRKSQQVPQIPQPIQMPHQPLQQFHYAPNQIPLQPSQHQFQGYGPAQMPFYPSPKFEDPPVYDA